jgi:hypothetical protein
VFRRLKGLVPVLALAGVLAGVAAAAISLTQISSDPYSSPTLGQHHTEVEPDTFANGSTIVAGVQMGRFFDGGSTDTGFATSIDGGATWAHGALPGVTKQEGGTFDRGSDPSVAYDKKHGVWLITTLAITGTTGKSVLVSRSSNGTTWNNPVTGATGGFADKNWIACDNTASSPFYGNCYTEWDDANLGDRVEMTTSSDGGLTWGPSRITADTASGLGGQPLVKANGVVVVPYWTGGDIRYFTSTNGGASWTASKEVASTIDHGVAGNLRTEPLPSAEIDKKNKIYIVWQDCRFRSGCSANDIVMSTLTNKFKLSGPVRIPIDPTTSGIDHFIPGIAVDRSTGGKRNPAHLGLAYYYYPNTNCNSSTCQLDVGYVSSTDGGSTWSAPTQLAGPMTLSWLASTNQGVMVGDYISASFVNGKVYPAVVVAHAPSGGVFDEALYTPAGGLAVAGGTSRAVAGPVLGTASDHPRSAVPPTAQ